MAQIFAWSLPALGTLAWAVYVVWLLTFEGGVRLWWRERETVRLAFQSALGFGAIPLIWWTMALYPYIKS